MKREDMADQKNYLVEQSLDFLIECHINYFKNCLYKCYVAWIVCIFAFYNHWLLTDQMIALKNLPKKE